jgi:hypothetical protein
MLGLMTLVGIQQNFILQGFLSVDTVKHSTVFFYVCFSNDFSM